MHRVSVLCGTRLYTDSGIPGADAGSYLSLIMY